MKNRSMRLVCIFFLCAVFAFSAKATTVDIVIKFPPRDVISNDVTAQLYFSNEDGSDKYSIFHSEVRITSGKRFEFRVESGELNKDVCIKVTSEILFFLPTSCFTPYIAEALDSSRIEKGWKLVPTSEAQSIALKDVRSDIKRGDWKSLEKSRDTITKFTRDYSNAPKYFFITWSDFLIKSYEKRFYSIPVDLVEVNCIFIECEDDIGPMNSMYRSFHSLNNFEKYTVRANFLNAIFRIRSEDFIDNYFSSAEKFFDKVGEYVNILESDVDSTKNYKKEHWISEFRNFCDNTWKGRC